MPTPPEGFRKALAALDPHLHIRWGNGASCWIIERDSNTITQEEVYYLRRRFERVSRWAKDPSRKDYVSCVSTARQLHEELESALAKRRIIVFAHELNDRLYNDICMGDMQRYGGYCRFTDIQEAEEAKKMEDRARQERNTDLAIASEFYDIVSFIGEKKLDMLLNGERNINKLLHGEASNKPVIEY